MTIETALFSYLSGKSEITSLVGSNPSRVYATVAPSSPTFPYITFQMISNNPEHHLSGNSPITVVRMQFDAWARTVQTQQDISEALRNVLDGYRELFKRNKIYPRHCAMFSMVIAGVWGPRVWM